MPALPIIADTYRVALNWTDGIGHQSVNVMHILKAGSSASAVAAAIDANSTALMWQYVSGAYIQERIDVTPLDGSSATYSLTTSGAKWTGGTGGDQVPAACMVITAHTTFRGRSRRGRMYVGPTGEGNLTAGVFPAGAGFTNTVNAWATFLAAMIAAGFQPVVASYLHASQVPINQYIPKNVAATQRRRQSRLNP